MDNSGLFKPKFAPDIFKKKDTKIDAVYLITRGSVLCDGKGYHLTFNSGDIVNMEQYALNNQKYPYDLKA